MGGACSTHREMENMYTILFREPKRKRLLGRPKSEWDDNM